MSDPVEHPPSGGPEEPDDDAWATACAEDLAAEKARLRAESGHQADAAEEFRRLADAVSEKVADLGRSLGTATAAGAAQGVAQQIIGQARSVIEPVVEKNPQVFGHLAAAGGELLAAFRAAVEGADDRRDRRNRPDGPDSGGGERP